MGTFSYDNTASFPWGKPSKIGYAPFRDHNIQIMFRMIDMGAEGNDARHAPLLHLSRPKKKLR